jgi:hypothetical protein
LPKSLSLSETPFGSGLWGILVWHFSLCRSR